MATLKLRRSELHNLPPVCTCCGDPATEVRAETFTWRPQWVRFMILLGLLPWLLVMLFTRQTATVHLPFCQKHIRVGRNLMQFVVAGFILTAGLIGTGAAMRGGAYDEMSQGVILSGVGMLVLTLLVVIFGDDGGARATLITDNTITLERVSPELVEAIEGGGLQGGVPRGVMQLQTAKYLRTRKKRSRDR